MTSWNSRRLFLRVHILLVLSFQLSSQTLSNPLQRAPENSDFVGEYVTLSPMVHLGAKPGNIYWGPGIELDMGSTMWRLQAALDLVNDGQWLPQETWMTNGLYWNLRYSYVQIFPGPFHLEAGFIPATHLVSQNPYSMILDNQGKSSLGAAYSFLGNLITYHNRWIGLHFDSPFTYGYGDPSIGGNPFNQTWADRGFNHKLYLINLGNWTLGYQEASIFMNRFFDANYFLNPVPSLFINTLWSNQEGNQNPWVHRHNDSSFMGLYGQYQGPNFRLEGELMLMDLNVPVSSFTYSDNLTKAGWSLGGSLDTKLGTFSFWHGGATKHMFAATYTRDNNPNLHPTEYTFYPVSNLGGRDIPLELNYIGYPFGENSLAFQTTWQKPFSFLLGNLPLELHQSVSLEYVVSGSKSPHNPWHEDKSWRDIDQTVQLFDGDQRLEHRLMVETKSTFAWNNFFINLTLGLGAKVNPLELVPQGTDPAIWKPGTGTRNESYFRLTLGYQFRITQ